MTRFTFLSLLTTIFCVGLLCSCRKDDEPGPSPDIKTFTATPASITSGQSATLSWSVDHAETISINQGIAVVTGTDLSVSPTITTTYTLKAENEAGVDSAKVTITVSVDPGTLVVQVDQAAILNDKPRKLLGITFEGRSSLNGGSGISIGYHDMNTGVMLPALQPLWSRLPITGLRYPGNAVSFNWNWKLTIGPFANRVAQTLAPNISAKLAFGFDEFMQLVEARGLTGSDVQIMVNIYDIANEISPAQNAADWVEYCNTPNDGSNPGGGTDWAALRATNGHAAPYSIKIWNIGNEPWGPSEYNFDPAPYIPKAVAIINAMKAIDPTIQITLPTVGPPTSVWTNAIMTSSSLTGKFWGISPHFFYDEDAATNSPNIIQDQTLLKALETATKAKGLKIVIGDHAHDAPASNPDKGFKWQGALATADFLLMASQVTNIDRANYWIYGSWLAQWHPIRRNNDGTFTFMAAAALYEELYPVMYDKSLSASVSTFGAGAPTSVRASAFQSSDALKLSVIVVNIDISNGRKVSVPVVSGYSLQNAKQLKGNLTDDAFTKSKLSLNSDGTYTMATASVLILEFNKN